MHTHRALDSIFFRRSSLAGLLLAPGLLAGHALADGFVEDSSAKLTTRNYYLSLIHI